MVVRHRPWVDAGEGQVGHQNLHDSCRAMVILMSMLVDKQGNTLLCNAYHYG